MREKEKNSGITLIALVVTIIALLILAGISLAMLTGQNGILNQTTQAKENTDEARIREKIRLAISSAAIDGMGEVTIDKLENRMKEEFGIGNYEIRETEIANEWKVVAFTSNSKEVYEIVNAIGSEKIIKVLDAHFGLTNTGKVVRFYSEEQWGEAIISDELDYINGVKKCYNTGGWDPHIFCILDNNGDLYKSETWGIPIKVEELENISDIEMLGYGVILAKTETNKLYIVSEYKGENTVIEIGKSYDIKESGIEGYMGFVYDEDDIFYNEMFHGYITTEQGKLYYVSGVKETFLDEVSEISNVDIIYVDNKERLFSK